MFKHFDDIEADQPARIRLNLALDGLERQLDGVPAVWRTAVSPLSLKKETYLQGRGLVHHLVVNIKTGCLALEDAPPERPEQDRSMAVDRLDAVLKHRGL